ncbi:MAG: glycine/betaine ABC transporter substrate-binding protein [Treponema sp.]|jgi:osmoprotectant transport system substrate-binding protein|nr:glycine/betaine ABC transporter substrate-binding protein [Treponema sp.]
MYFRSIKKSIALFFVMVAVAGGVFAASNRERGAGKEPVRIGSKNFTENLILAEIYALALEAEGIPVKRNFGLASSVVHTAIVNNEIDLYPEYTGTGLLAVLQHDLVTDPQEVYRIVKTEYEKRFNLVWLDYAQANDGQGLVVTAEISRQYGIRTISDLQANAARIRFASQGEFDEREDGIPGLTAVYGPFGFQSSRVYDNALKYEVLLRGEADAAPAYTTEGQLATPAFVLLEDDKHVWPPYNIAPVVRKKTLEQYPLAATILNRVNKTIDTPTITALNARVDVDKREYTEVAREFFNSIVK